MIIKYLKFNLKTREQNKKFLQFRAERKNNPNNENHHLLGSPMGGKKFNDYLLAELSTKEHQLWHSGKHRDIYFEMAMLTDAIEGMINYIEHLEKQLAEANHIVKAALESKKAIVQMFEDKE